MTLWALSRPDDLDPALELLRLADDRGLLDPLGLGALLGECEQRGLLDEQVALLWRAARGGLGAAATNVAAARLAAAGRAEEALALLEAAATAGFHDALSCRLARALGGGAVAAPARDRVAAPVLGGGRWGAFRAGSKALQLLPHVLEARGGDATAVVAAIEAFAGDVLRPARQWFKIAGGTKGQVLVGALGDLPAAGVILEIGTYVGYSALRLSTAQPRRRVVSLEVDPGNAVVAQCVAMHAGRAHLVDVWTGHSKDVLPRLAARYPSATTGERGSGDGNGGGGGLPAAGVFMDQCGARFWEDLQELARLGLLAPDAAFVADNVLKPGAPRLLWQLFARGGDFQAARVVSVPEFGMPGVEDWLAVARYRPRGAEPMAAPSAPEPAEIDALEWEAQRLRLRAAGPGGVPFEEWAAFAAQLRARLATLGIAP